MRNQNLWQSGDCTNVGNFQRAEKSDRLGRGQRLMGRWGHRFGSGFLFVGQACGNHFELLAKPLRRLRQRRARLGQIAAQMSRALARGEPFHNVVRPPLARAGTRQAPA